MNPPAKSLSFSATLLALFVLLLSGAACSTRTNNTTYKDRVETALQQADLKDVSVHEDNDRNTLTLLGTLHSEDAKNRAGEIAQSEAGTRVVVNEISVEPVGREASAKKAQSNLDEGIEKDYKAALITKGLDKRNIDFNAKNGVLTLKGSVKNPNERRSAQELAENIPNVNQVVNNIQVRR